MTLHPNGGLVANMGFRPLDLFVYFFRFLKNASGCLNKGGRSVFRKFCLHLCSGGASDRLKTGCGCLKIFGVFFVIFVSAPPCLIIGIHVSFYRLSIATVRAKHEAEPSLGHAMPLSRD